MRFLSDRSAYFLNSFMNRISPIHFLLLLLLAAISYSSIMTSYFLSDDFTLIGRVSNDGMFYTWGQDIGGYVRPVTVLTYVSDFWVWGLNPVGYHLTNILFHTLACIALFQLACVLMKTWGFTENTLPAFLTAILFLVLPCHSESVSWISGRTDVIATAFGITATFLFTTQLLHGSRLRGFLSILLLAVALYSKESVIILPVVWLLLLVAQKLILKKYPSRESIWTLTAAFLCIIVFLGARRVILGNFIGESGPGIQMNILSGEIPENLLRYVIRVFLPALPEGIVTFLSYPLGVITLLLSFSLVIYAVIKCCRTLCRNRKILLSAVMGAAFLICLLPVIGFKVSIFDTLSERFLYLPSAFACIFLVSVVFTFVRNQWASIAILLVITAFEFATLQWINTRWITAGNLSRSIANNVSMTDPDKILILNLPDNYRGAYIFRGGLTEAATTFLGLKRAGEYRVVSTHNLTSLTDNISVHEDESGITVIIPDHLEFCSVESYGYHLQDSGDTLTILCPKTHYFLYFDKGIMRLIHFIYYN